MGGGEGRREGEGRRWEGREEGTRREGDGRGGRRGQGEEREGDGDGRGRDEERGGDIKEKKRRQYKKRVRSEIKVSNKHMKLVFGALHHVCAKLICTLER